ncbi:MAG TPA: glutamate-cysteine ligase family protein [Longimicrobium sp.]|jgi:glutamate--cysteine ligase|nr:glutamate-cysteine ligase family protein [Longimicrobium sp.]
MLELAALAADLRDNAFGARRKSVRPPSIGAEVELIPVDADTRAQLPICAPEGRSTLPFLHAFAARAGWKETASVYGMPNWLLPDGGTITFEPGGQVELSAPPFRSASALLRSLRAVVQPLVSEAREEGIELLSVGIEPLGAVDEVPLQLPGERYVRLTRFMEDQGTGGTRMMRQTAAFQCNLDWGDDAPARWRFLNALAPYTVAVFANSPVYRGEPTGERSFRARVWRELGGGRTGIFAAGPDPIPEYLRFALDAPAILLPFAPHEWLPFGTWNERGRVTEDHWKAHLTTLFPDVRPKGFVEVRGADAVAPEWYAAPLVFFAGLTYHAPSFAAARELVGSPDAALLDHAGRAGLADERIGSVSRDLFELALAGAESLGPAFIAPADLEEARAFFQTYTSRSLSPADDTLAACTCAGD